jgi:hypothetical protein
MNENERTGSMIENEKWNMQIEVSMNEAGRIESSNDKVK